METEGEYLGVPYQIELVERKGGRWDWWYKVGDAPLIENTDSPLKSREQALGEATESVKRTITSMQKLK